jgi:hypothetical protein
MANASKHWFPAKRYGWGWGPPIAWQGWVVLGAYFVVLVVISLAIPPAAHPAGFIAAVSALSALLVAVCWLKGEPPR